MRDHNEVEDTVTHHNHLMQQPGMLRNELAAMGAVEDSLFQRHEPPPTHAALPYPAGTATRAERQGYHRNRRQAGTWRLRTSFISELLHAL